MDILFSCVQILYHCSLFMRDGVCTIRAHWTMLEPFVTIFISVLIVCVLYAVCWSDPFNSIQNEIVRMNRAYGRKWSLFCFRSQTRHSNHAIEHTDIIQMKDYFLFCSSNAILKYWYSNEQWKRLSSIYTLSSMFHFDDGDKFWKWHERLFMGNLFKKVQSKSVEDYVRAIFRIFIVSRRISFM